MFVIVHNSSVILGPMRWNRYRFENTIQEELELEIPIILPDINESDVITINEEVKIYPVIGTIQEQFNPRTQHLHGPFWQFTDNGATASYIAQDLSIDAVKNQLKAEVANQRWIKENKGTNLVLNGVEYNFSTTKENRSVLQQALLSNLPELNWKLTGDQWVLLTPQDVQTILQSIIQYVQTCFDWELSKCNEIDSCQTLQQLNDVIIQAES